MEVKISVKPHIRKFLLKKYDTQEPLKISSGEYIGDVFTSLGLSKKRNKKYSIYKEDYTSSILIQLNQDLERVSLSDQDLMEINTRLEKIFKDEMYVWAICATSFGSFASRGIKKFLAHYKVENDYTWESAYRAWQRFINREYLRKKECVS